MPVTGTVEPSGAPGRTRFVSGKNGRRFAGALILVFCFALFSGCRSEEPQPVAEPTPPPVEVNPDEEPQPEPSDESVEEILRDVLNVYQHDMLKYYSDQGYVKIVYESGGAKNEIRRNASLTFQKPNYVRMQVADGTLISDGDYIWGKIDIPLYNGQILKVKAPHIFSSVREFYPDLKLGIAMNMPLPQDIFWAPPQLILLMAREPLKTLIGINAFLPTPGAPVVKLLAPRYLSFDKADPNAEKIACDRISVNAPEGGRIFWVNRETNGIVRIELPIERIEVPEGVDRVLELSMDFPNQVIADEAPPSDVIPPEQFTVRIGSGVEEVDHFVSAELSFYGHKAPPIRLIPLFSGDSPLVLDEPHRRIRVFALWGGSGNSALVWERSKALLQQMYQTATMFVNDPRFEFYAVNVDDNSRSDAGVLSDYGLLGFRFPLYRVRFVDLKRPPIGSLSKPSLVIIDADGIVQKYYNQPTSYVTLQANLINLGDGRDIYKADITAFETAARGLEDLLASAEENDYYAIRNETSAAFVHYAPFALPEKISLTQVWTQTLSDPSNPLVISDDVSAGPGAIPNKSILIPYGGNLIAVLDPGGKLLRSQPTGTGEPVSFLRTVRAGDGKRYIAASSFLDTHKVSIFGGRLEPISTANLASARQQWVADALLNDVNEDGEPELIVALCGDNTSNLIPIHGIYSVATQAEPGSNKCRIYWKDERVIAPYRIGFVRGKVPGGEPRRALMAMNSPSDGKGELIENDIGNGQRLRAIETPEDVSVVWFTPPDDASDPNKTTEIFAALLTHMGSPTPYFAVLSTDGEIICETPMEGSTWGNHTERIVSGDLDGDGKVEWIVPTREGVIWFFEENGSLIDKFALGREVTGAAIANWDDETFLIISHNTGVISYRIERNTDTPKEAATPANTEVQPQVEETQHDGAAEPDAELPPEEGTAAKESHPAADAPQTENLPESKEIPEQEEKTP